MPGTYQNIAATYGAIIDTAVSLRQYMTQPNDQFAIFSEFGADVPTFTVANPPYPYLISVDEPISKQPQSGHGHGMSQHGASRWARGNENSNINYTGTKWSVTLSQPFQILTHYYTGIHVRDANNPSTILTPNDRWAPLSLEWDYVKQAPEYVCRGKTHIAKFTVQNTGTTTWEVNSSVQYRLNYSLSGKYGDSSVAGKPRFTVLPGGTSEMYLLVWIPTNTPGDKVTISVTMMKNGVPFSNWPVYSLVDLPFGQQGKCEYGVFFPSMRYPPYITTWWPQ